MGTLIVNRIDSVGIVDAGDNPDAEIVFFKRKVSTDERERLAERGQALPDGSFPIANVSDLRNAIQAFGRAGNKTAARRHIIKRARALGRVDLLPDGWNVAKMQDASTDSTEPEKDKGMSDFDVSELSDAAKDAFEELQKERDDALRLLDEATAADPEPEDVLKDLDGPVADIVKTMQSELAVLQKEREATLAELAKEKDDRLTKEYEDKAEAYVGVLGAEASDIGPVLKTLALADADAAAKLEGWLQTGAERVKPLLKTLGEDAGGDATAKIEALAKEKMANDKDLTVEAARVAVRKENPELLAAEREEGIV